MLTSKKSNLLTLLLFQVAPLGMSCSSLSTPALSPLLSSAARNIQDCWTLLSVRYETRMSMSSRFSFSNSSYQFSFITYRQSEATPGLAGDVSAPSDIDWHQHDGDNSNHRFRIWWRFRKNTLKTRILTHSCDNNLCIGEYISPSLTFNSCFAQLWRLTSQALHSASFYKPVLSPIQRSCSGPWLVENLSRVQLLASDWSIEQHS